jgi:uncharacterized DUF497 family protein
METEWDPAKRLANLAKHGLDFEDVALLDWDNSKVLPDTRKAYPEPRFRAFAMSNGRLHMVVFCIRGTKVRVISFRKANKKEVTRYGS